MAFDYGESAFLARSLISLRDSGMTGEKRGAESSPYSKRLSKFTYSTWSSHSR